MLPIPAEEVFASAAAPLHLPALDEYLSNKILFAPPRFSDTHSVCTRQERDLCGLDSAPTAGEASQGGSWLSGGKSDRSDSRLGRRNGIKFEVAGGQLKCPPQAFASSTSNSSKRSRQGPSGLRSRKPRYAKLSTQDGLDADLETGDLMMNQLAKHAESDDDDDDDDDSKTVVGSDAGIIESKQATKLAGPSKYALPSPAASGLSGPTMTGVSSQLSTATHPKTRLEMFPPLMLLKENSLDELKSNAIGPRKPPGGIWSVNFLGTIFDMIIGVEGSNFAAELFRLELFRDFFQIMAMNLHFEKVVGPGQGSRFDLSGLTTGEKAQKVLLQIIPSLLGLDLVSVFGYAVIIFIVWILITGLALWRFWRMTTSYDPNRSVEGFESQQWIYKSTSRGTKLMNTILVFILSTLYLPLSKLAIDAIVWSSDFWAVPNPYLAGEEDPRPAPLGDPDIWRDPMDFCYTTTMRRDGFNWAYVVIPLAVITVIAYTLWYPYRMMVAIKSMLPNVSEYNELGKKRSQEEMDIEYSRLLDRDKSPLNFLYNSYRRKWGFYKPMYILFFKLSNLLIIGVVNKQNCLFRSVPTRTMLMVQQIVLIVVMSVLLGAHVYVKPFVDMISNRSEMVSRMGYVFTAVIGLLVALNVDGSTVYNTTVLYVIQGMSYSGNIYFAIIGTSIAAHQVKRWQKRVDFSIDIFSPLLDLQKHIKRRVWQETLSIILLCGRDYHMPLEHVIAFSMSDTNSWPPYLLNYQGSVAERHIENLKIVKEMGIEEFKRRILLSRTREGKRIAELLRIVQHHYAGPDAYYRPEHPPFPSGVSSFFGKAFVVPFPPTLIMRYDQGPAHTVSLTTLEELEAFVRQNDSADVVSRRMVRQGLRALEGQRVLCPYVDSVTVGDGAGPIERWITRVMRDRRGRIRRISRALQTGQRDTSRSYTLVTPVSYLEGTLHIERRPEHEWNGYNFASGFDVKIVYDQGGKRREPNGALTTVHEAVEVSGSRAFGLHDDFEMTQSLARFFQDNEVLVKERVPWVEQMIQRYRTDFEKEARLKDKVMPYSFETDIFDNHYLDPEELRATLDRISRNRALRDLPRRYEGSITLMFERLEVINRSPVHRYWWLLFDEIWRLNSGDYKRLRYHRRSFSPHFPTSIAYTPLPRAQLERFLEKRSLWTAGGSKGGPFNRGLLNRIYFYLNEIVFAGHHDSGSSIRGRQSNLPRAADEGKEDDEGEGGDEEGETSSQCSIAAGRYGRPANRNGKRKQRAAAIPVGLGKTREEATRREYLALDEGSGLSQERETRYTGGGTAYSISSVIDRSAYMWEQRMSGKATSTKLQRLKIRTMQWLNLYPVVTDFGRQKLFLYVRLVDGDRYELLKGRCTPPSQIQVREAARSEAGGEPQA